MLPWAARCRALREAPSASRKVLYSETQLAGAPNGSRGSALCALTMDHDPMPERAPRGTAAHRVRWHQACRVCMTACGSPSTFSSRLDETELCDGAGAGRPCGCAPRFALAIRKIGSNAPMGRVTCRSSLAYTVSDRRTGNINYISNGLRISPLSRHHPWPAELTCTVVNTVKSQYCTQAHCSQSSAPAAPRACSARLAGLRSAARLRWFATLRRPSSCG